MAKITSEQLRDVLKHGESAEIWKGIETSSKILPLMTKLPNMSGRTYKIKVEDHLPIAYFVNAVGGMKKTTDMGWRGVYLTAEEVAIIVPIAQADLDDSEIDIWGQVKPRLIEAGQQVVDLAILTGQGKPDSWREGLLPSINQHNAFIIPQSQQTLYSQINDAMEKVEASGYEVSAIAGSVGLKSKFRMMLDTTGQPLNATEIGSLPRVFINNGSWDDSLASLVVGDFKQAVYSIRQDFTFDVLTEGVIQDPITKEILYNLAQQDMIAIRMVFRMGWALPNPTNRLNSTETRFPFAAIKGTGALTTVNETITVIQSGTEDTYVKGASVFLGGNGLKTDDSGKAVFKALQDTTYPVEIRAEGYRPYTTEVTTTKAAAEVKIMLEKAKQAKE